MKSLVVVFGLPGTGKSRLARALARKLKALHLNSDVVRKKFLKSPSYALAEKNRVYRKMTLLASKALGGGKSVVLDATFSKQAWRDQVKALAKRVRVEPVFIQLVPHPPTVRERLRKRAAKKGEESEADYAVFLKLKKEFEPFREKHLKLDSALPFRKKLSLAWKEVGAKNAERRVI